MARLLGNPGILGQGGVTKYSGGKKKHLQNNYQKVVSIIVLSIDKQT